MFKSGTLLLVAAAFLFFVVAGKAYSAPAPDITSLDIITVCSDLQCSETTGLYSVTLPGSVLTSVTVQQIGYSSNNALTYSGTTIPLYSSLTLNQNSIVYGFLYNYILNDGPSGTLTATALSANTYQLWTASIQITLTPPPPILTITKDGTGAGDVNANTGVLVWNGVTGTASYPRYTIVTLTATPSAGSSFFGWGGACGGYYNVPTCGILMGTDQLATATFSVIPNARIGNTPYGTLANAYAAIADGEIVEAKALTFDENLTLDRPVNIIVRGGFSNDYVTHDGYTTLNGTLIIQNGSVIVEGLVISPQ